MRVCHCVLPYMGYKHNPCENCPNNDNVNRVPTTVTTTGFKYPIDFSKEDFNEKIDKIMDILKELKR